MTDPIADMLTRLRNAVAVKKPEVVLPFSQVKFSIAKLLEAEHYIKKAEKIEVTARPFIRVELKYENGHPALNHLKRISKPGQKIYVNKENVPRVLNGFGLAIVSTSKGIMSSQQARRDKVGGELMCEIW
jgi:small subunit ribosomal protein S8